MGSKSMVQALNYCKGNFSACKSAEDSSVEILSSCCKTSTEIMKEAATLTANIAGVQEANKTAVSLASGSRKRFSRAAAKDCAEVISKNSMIITFGNDMASSPKIYQTAAEVTNLTGISCTTAQKATLTAQTTNFTSVVTEMTVVLAAIQSNIQVATGSTASSAQIANVTSSLSVTSASSKRRNIVARHLMNRLNLN